MNPSNFENLTDPATLLRALNAIPVSLEDLADVADVVVALFGKQFTYGDLLTVVEEGFPDDLVKGTAVLVRIRALDEFLQHHSVLSLPSGVVLAAVAAEPIIQVGCTLTFERQAFMRHVLELTNPAIGAVRQ